MSLWDTVLIGHLPIVLIGQPLFTLIKQGRVLKRHYICPDRTVMICPDRTLTKLSSWDNCPEETVVLIGQSYCVLIGHLWTINLCPDETVVIQIVIPIGSVLRRHKGQKPLILLDKRGLRGGLLPSFSPHKSPHIPTKFHRKKFFCELGINRINTLSMSQH